MNAKLKNTPDGVERKFFEARVSMDGKRLPNDVNFGRIYWPFALSENVLAPRYPSFDITHLPSGYGVLRGVPGRTAHALIRKLRALPVSWDFTAAHIPKKVKELATPIVKPLHQRYAGK